MNRNHDEISVLFRDKLQKAEIPVRCDLWDTLQTDLSLADRKRKIVAFRCRYLRFGAAAASVLLLLGSALAAFWFCLPEDEIKDAISQAQVMARDMNQPSIVTEPLVPIRGQSSSIPSSVEVPTVGTGPVHSPHSENDESGVSVRVMVSISHHNVYGRNPDGHSSQNRHYIPVNEGQEKQNTFQFHADNATCSVKERAATPWSFSAGVGTALPDVGFSMPLTLSVTAGYRFNQHLSLESGLQYNYLPSAGYGTENAHTLGIPVKLNVDVAHLNKRVGLYAVMGGTVEKAFGTGQTGEPFMLSALAGIGLECKLNRRLALFAEPTVSHYFDTGGKTKTLRTECATNFNLLCGVRMCY